jgi:hypothetical protein
MNPETPPPLASGPSKALVLGALRNEARWVWSLLP